MDRISDNNGSSADTRLRGRYMPIVFTAISHQRKRWNAPKN